MYDVSQEYIDAIMSNSVHAEWFGTITTEGGTVYNIKEENIALGGSSFVSECVSGDAIEFGNAFSNQLKLQIYLDYDSEANTYYINEREVNRYDLYNAEIKMTFRLYFDEEYTEYEDVTLPTFVVAEPTWQNDLLTLSAFDFMKKFDKKFATTSSATVFGFFGYCCINCGVGLGMTEEDFKALPTGASSSFTVSPYNMDETVPTYTTAISYLAQLLGCNAYIGSDDKLYLKPYKTDTDRTISSDWRFSSEIADYETYYTAITERDITKEKDLYIESKKYQEDDLVYNMGSNPFMQYGIQEFKYGFLQIIIDYLDDVQYTPFTITTPLDPALEIMDCINLVDNQAVDGKIGALTSVEYALNGSMTLKCVGQNPKSKFTSPVESAIASYGGGGGGEGSKIVFRDYTNVEELTVKTGDTRKKLFVLDFFANSSTHISMQAEINHTMTVDDGYNYGHIVITYVLYFNGYSKEVNYTPTQDEFTGNHLLHLLYNFTAEENSLGRLEAYINVTWGTFHVEPENVIAGLWGQGLTGEIDWDGRIDVQEDDIPLFKLDLQTEPMQDNVNIAFKDPILINKNENMSLFELDLQTDRIVENVTHKEEVE